MTDNRKNLSEQKGPIPSLNLSRSRYDRRRQFWEIARARPQAVLVAPATVLT